MGHLKVYPSEADIRAVIGDDMDEKVSELENYQRNTEIATCTFDDVTGKNLRYLMLRSWLIFFDAVKKEYPDAVMGKNYAITRPKTRAELEAAVITNVRSHRYSHPEQYPEYTPEDIVT